MALHLTLSNSLETLADRFAETLSMAGKDPFETLQAVVPNGGMGTFLRRHLARKNHQKIAANIEMPFLQKFITDRICAVLTPEECKKFRRTINLWAPEVLSWRIDALLKNSQEKEFADYWAGDPVRRHLLACEIAGNFDRYQIYRSSVAGHTTLSEWRSGRNGTSQGKLYCRLCAEVPDPDSFYTAFFSTGAIKSSEKVGVFGISSMPPLYFHCLKKLAESMEIFLFCPSPCQVYWGDILSRKDLSQMQKEDPDCVFGLLEENSRNNQLLANFGVSGREFFNLLATECFGTGSGPEEEYVDPGENGNALQIFQSDILNARARNSTNGNRIQLSPQDDSIRINCCTDARRELEILHDQLLELFYGTGKAGAEKSVFKVTNKLRFEDVIVMFPDINSAAPVIDAVFANGPFKGHYAICDRSSAGQSQVIDCFSRLLDLPSSRISSENILELLEFGCINSNLGIPAENLPALTDLLVRAKISWGLDEEEHSKFRQTPFKEFSWQDGIDKLMTEYARGEDTSVIYPADDSGGIDGELARDFGKTAEFIALLKEWRSQLYNSRTPGEWGEFIQNWIAAFFNGSEKEYLPEINELRRAAGKVISDAATAYGEESELIAPEIFISRLKSEYSLPGGKQHFLRDKITFCSLVPLRAVPAKVIAVLGLNDGEFPGIDRHNSFDLMAQFHRNDPNRTNDGRYLFLEALMAAREHLILSYIGIDNGEKLFPAVPLGEVEEVLADGFGISKSQIPLKSLELESLQKLRRPQIFSAEDMPGDQNDFPSRTAPEIMPVNLLGDLLTQNCRNFCKIRYGFDYQKFEKAQPATDDPEKINPLDESKLLKALWAMELAEIEIPRRKSLAEKCRFLPVSGDTDWERACQIVAGLAEKLADVFRNRNVFNCELPLPCGVTLTGTIAASKDAEGNIDCSEIYFSNFSPEKLFRSGLKYLLLSACHGSSCKVSGKAVFAKMEPAKDGKLKNCYIFPSSPEPQALLNTFVERALCTYTAPEPLPLFAHASSNRAKSDFSESNVLRTFLEKDVKYNAVIERFFDESILQTPAFQKLAEDVFSFTANTEPCEL